MAKWVVVPVAPEGYQDVARAPDSKLSVTKATEYVRTRLSSGSAGSADKISVGSAVRVHDVFEGG